MVLVGGGHANVQVLRFLAENLTSLVVRPSDRTEGETGDETTRTGVSLTLISGEEKASYSGMLPGALAGLYTPSLLQIDLPSLCEWCGAKFVCEWAESIDRQSRHVLTSSGSRIPFDLLALDVGSISSVRPLIITFF